MTKKQVGECTGWFGVNLTEVRVREEGASVEEISPCDPTVRHFLISDQWGRAQPMMGGVIPELLVLDSIRKQTEQAMRTKSVSSTLHGLCISSCLWDPALCEFLF